MDLMVKSQVSEFLAKTLRNVKDVSNLDSVLTLLQTYCVCRHNQYH